MKRPKLKLIKSPSPIELLVRDMEVKVLLRTNVFFNVLTFLVVGSLFGVLLNNPNNIADKTLKASAKAETHPKNFLGVD